MAEAPSFSLDLPDPESDSISSMEFLARIEEAWAICDRFDLQTEIWRGRILRAVRDRERRGGEGRGCSFRQATFGGIWSCLLQSPMWLVA